MTLAAAEWPQGKERILDIKKWALYCSYRCTRFGMAMELS